VWGECHPRRAVDVGDRLHTGVVEGVHCRARRAGWEQVRTMVDCALRPVNAGPVTAAAEGITAFREVAFCVRATPPVQSACGDDVSQGYNGTRAVAHSTTSRSTSSEE